MLMSGLLAVSERGLLTLNGYLAHCVKAPHFIEQCVSAACVPICQTAPRERQAVLKNPRRI